MPYDHRKEHTVRSLRRIRLISRIFPSAVLLSCFPWLLLLAGCGADVKVDLGRPPTVTISASPTSITAGSSSVLTVTATNATQVTLTGSDGTTYTLQPSGGTQTVTPAASATYTASATGAGGKATATATVTITGAPTPTPTVTISASPTSIAPGGSSVLSVTAANATQVTLTGSDGSTYTLQPSGGTQTASPAASATYTASATGAGGKASATATVTVTAASSAPTVTLTASPTSITAGNSSTLSVTATNATQVTLTGSDGSTYILQPSGGTQTVTPAASATYTASATGAGGKTSATATVTVTAAPSAPTVTLTASPTSITAGSSSTLRVTATNATQVTLTGSDGSGYTLAASGGSQTVTPAATTTYTAAATGAGGKATSMATVTVTAAPTVTVSASPNSIAPGGSSVLSVTATNATQVTLTGSDGSTYTLQPSGGTQTVSPATSATYTASATGAGGKASATATVTVIPPGSLQSIQHVVFMLQENRTFDSYFGFLNPYRAKNGWTTGADGVTYAVDGIEDKLTKISNQSDQGMSFSPFKFTSSCIDDLTSSWLESYGDLSRYDFSTTRPIRMDGFVHTAQNFANFCASSNGKLCSGTFTDTTGQRSMGYYDQDFLNYYYYMASQFAVSDRWFSPVSSKSIPNRIATFTGGTTQGLVFDPGNDDHLPQLDIPNIFGELDQAKVSWKIYYTVTQGACLQSDECAAGVSAQYPATIFGYLSYSYQYLYVPPSGTSCKAPTQPSSVVGDASNSFCIDPKHIAPLSTYYTDLTNGTLPSFAFIEAGYGQNDEHPGSGQSILMGQQQVAKVINSLMVSPSWKDSVFFLAYDEGGGPYDHVPPAPGHSNDFTDPTVGGTSKANIPDIGAIAVNADGYGPCVPTGGTATLHCDLHPPNDPGSHPTDTAAVNGFAAQLGFRVPNFVVSPFTRKHYVSHAPMDHTAVLKFVEDRFIGHATHLTPHDAAQPNLLDFFDFTGAPWATPPTPPSPVSAQSLGYDPCTPKNYGP